ncbi:MAG: InlB B-repeat-containing protein, partial [Syntrophales bacterium]
MKHKFWTWWAIVLMLAMILSSCGGGGGGGSATTYIVTYNGNGATGGSPPTDPTNYAQGQVITVLGNPGNLVKTNFTFAGWNTASDGSGTNYAQGQQFKMGSSNVILYAKWTANSIPTYTVTYNGNGNTGGTVPIDTTNYEQGQTVTVQGNTGNLVKTGYSFTGWTTLANASGTNYTPGQTFRMGTANVVLYATWTANPTYTVTYNGNGSTGGSPPTDSLHYEQNQIVTVLGNPGNLVKINFTFAGWNTALDSSSGTNYAQGQQFKMGSSNVILYAKWTANSIPTYTVTYNGNGNTGGIVPIDTNNYQQGQTVTV